MDHKPHKNIKIAEKRSTAKAQTKEPTSKSHKNRIP